MTPGAATRILVADATLRRISPDLAGYESACLPLALETSQKTRTVYVFPLSRRPLHLSHHPPSLPFLATGRRCHPSNHLDPRERRNRHTRFPRLTPTASTIENNKSNSLLPGGTDHAARHLQLRQCYYPKGSVRRQKQKLSSRTESAK